MKMYYSVLANHFNQKYYQSNVVGIFESKKVLKKALKLYLIKTVIKDELMGEGISNYKAYEKTLKHYNLPNDTELTNKQFVYYLNLWSLIELLKYFSNDKFQFEIKKHILNVCEKYRK